MMKVSRIVQALEAIAPPSMAQEWDNVGLLVGDPSRQTSALLLCIDLTEETLSEAVRAKAGMVLAYHPVIFKPLSRITADAVPVLYQVVRRGLAVYSTHTALDAAPGGTNDILAEAMGLEDRRPLEPAGDDSQCKVVVFVPPDEASRVADAAFAAGAGRIGNYAECAFFCHGIGSFFGQPGAHPRVGQAGRREVAEELRLEMIAPVSKAAEVCAAIRAVHSYEQPAIDVYPLRQHPPGYGMGRIGRLSRPVTVGTLINRLKRATKLKRVLVASGAAGRGRNGLGSLVSTAACCAGSCGSVFRSAIKAGATFYLTGEMRHHDALEAAAAGMTVVCLGHSNSERIALRRLAERLNVVLPGLKVLVSKRDRDPFEII